MQMINAGEQMSTSALTHEFLESACLFHVVATDSLPHQQHLPF